MKNFQISTVALIAAFARGISREWVWRAERMEEAPAEFTKGSGVEMGTSPNVDTEEVDGHRFHAQVGFNAHYVSRPIYDGEKREVGVSWLNFFHPPDFIEIFGGVVNLYLSAPGEDDEMVPMAMALSEDWSTIDLTEAPQKTD